MDVAAALMSMLYAELDRAHRAERVWVMDLDRYKQMRRIAPAHKPDDDDEATWEPSPDDRLMGLPILVRDDGGEPHIEWLTREEIGL